jgi:hypothetical protein
LADFHVDGTEIDALPVLIALLEDEDPLIVYLAASELRHRGERGRPAVPSLVRLCRSDLANRKVILSRLDLGTVGDALRDALAQIDPEATVQAGIK